MSDDLSANGFTLFWKKSNIGIMNEVKTYSLHGR